MNRIGERTEESIFVAGGIRVLLETKLSKDSGGVLVVTVKISTEAPVRIIAEAEDENVQERRIARLE